MTGQGISVPSQDRAWGSFQAAEPAGDSAATCISGPQALDPRLSRSSTLHAQ